MKQVLVATVAALSFGASLAQDSKGVPTAAQLQTAMKAVDADNDGKLNRKEAQRLGITSKAFKAANPDGDSTLGMTELLAAVLYMFNAANPDDDGTLDWTEAQKAGIKSKEAFEAANPDKDGTLDVAEYLTALTKQVK